jgi:hypothetical protein
MATAVLSVDGQDMTIGTRPHWKVGITTGNAEWVIVTTLKGQVLATEARQQDFHQDPEFAERTAGLATQRTFFQDVIESHNAGVNPAVIHMYYTKHNLNHNDIEVTDDEMESHYQAVVRDKDALRQHLNQAKQRIVQDDLSADELQSWKLLITRLFRGHDDKDAFRKQMRILKLGWTREVHLKTLRDNATIEILVDLD